MIQQRLGLIEHSNQLAYARQRKPIWVQPVLQVCQLIVSKRTEHGAWQKRLAYGAKQQRRSRDLMRNILCTHILRMKLYYNCVEHGVAALFRHSHPAENAALMQNLAQA